jgi:nicotinate-nucleotide adenylyltransferase
LATDPAAARRAVPAYSPGMRIGLLGGSFNPPHEAHRAISRFALTRLKLDRIWWLVSPGNPLKDVSGLRELDARAAAAQAMADDPRIQVSCLEAAIGTRYTADTVDYLVQHCPGARFVWIMGADNLAQFHRWQRWQQIAASLPIAVIDRPPATFRALAAPAAQTLKRYRLPNTAAATLADRSPPSWIFLTGLKSPLSSTSLRNPDGSWKK